MLIAIGTWAAPTRAEEPAVSEAPADTAGEPGAAESTTEPNGEASEPGSENQAAGEEEKAPEDIELRDPTELAPGTRLHATLDLLANYTTNFFYTPDDEEGVWGWWLSPNVMYASSSPRFRSVSQVGATFAWYSLGGTTDDYRDLRGSTNANWKIAPDHRLGYDIALNQGHDPYGLVRTEENGTTSRSLDRWFSERYTLEYRYGAPRASLAIENKASVVNKTYHTNRTLPPGQGFGTEFLDDDIEQLQSTLFYQYSPKTSGLLDVVGAHVHFDKQFPGFSRDADEYRFRVGLRWVATAKTTGDFRVGYMTRHFRQKTVPGSGEPVKNYNRLDWVITGDWTPFTRTSIQVQTGRQSVESYNESLFIDVTYVNLTWRQEWTRRLSSSLHGGFNYGDFVYFQGGRQDTNYSLNLRVDYQLMPRIAVYAGYDLDNRSSDFGEFDYDRSTMYVGLKASY